MIDATYPRYRLAVIALLVAVSLALMYVFYFSLRLGTVFVHFFYLPIILAALWWGRRGVPVALFLAAVLAGGHVLQRHHYPSADDYVRAAMLVVISVVVAVLSERFTRARERTRHLNLVLRAIRDIDRLITKEKDRDRLLDGICRTLVRNRSYLFAWIALLDGERRLVCAAESGLGAGFYPMTEMLKFGTLPFCARRAGDRTGAVLVRDAALECAGCPLSAIHMGEGRMTVVINPGGRLRAILSVAVPESLSGDREERLLFEDIAGDIGYALGAMELRGDHATTLEELRESEERFRSIVEHAPFAYYRIDESGRFTYVNPEWERVLGFTVEEVVGRHFTFIQRGERREGSGELEARVLAGETVRGEFNLRRKDGSISHHTFTGQPVYRHGAIIGGEWFLNDITERTRAERALLRSERMMAQIIEGSPIPSFVIDGEGVVTHWNRACEVLTGFSAASMIGTRRHWEPFYETERPTMADMILESARDEAMAQKYEGEFRKSPLLDGAGDSERFFPRLGPGGQWLFFTAAPLRDEEGAIIGAIETLQDVTSRKRAEDEKERAHAELEQLFNATPVGIRVIDRNQRTVSLNWRFMEMFGLDSGHFGREDLFVRNREIIQIDRLLVKRIMAGEKQVEYEFRTGAPGGEVICIVHAAPYVSAEGEIIGVIENFTDITETRRLQDGIMRVAEKERQRIGQDLHDGLGQNLTAVTFMIEALKERMAGSYPDGVPVIENIEGMMRDAIVQTRGLSRMLSPVEMERNGLQSALDEMAAATEKVYHVSCRIRQEGSFFVYDSQEATHLFYIAREAVTNAIKHGKAGSIQISLIDDEGGMAMIIGDDGAGAPGGPADTGLGLRIMRYRAGVIGADFSAGNRDGGGFEVAVRMKK